jgi:hypothetical protein
LTKNRGNILPAKKPNHTNPTKLLVVNSITDYTTTGQPSP